MLLLKCETQVTELDREWVELIKEAKNIGLTQDEVKEFLRQK
ncbi:anti-repressor SinI family protein [Aquisalibacillus elongatus]|uniref:Anti-repressor SinI n=1 Tax=Aquisalibacillus elongatus TaxID=485577 RepID=A0A3N5C472_9BACI|nr:anti-repressor SinI family protein [Aquisalibacillus elongatus]RPF54262.1 anti-repressor SinI [Aquisalibacillus elongatus]